MSQHRVLVLSPDTESQRVVEGVLTPLDYEVLSTGDQAVAVRLLGEMRVDVVLVDLTLGILSPVPRWKRRRSDRPREWPFDARDGFAVLRNLGTSEGSPDGALVWLGNGVRLSAYRFSVVNCLPRPVRVSALLAVLKDALEQGRRPALMPQQSPFVIPMAGPPEDLACLDQERIELLRAVDSMQEGAQLRGGQTPPPSPPSTRVFESLPRGLRTVLVADSHSEDRQRLRDVLEPHSFTVHEVADGQEALRRALAQRPWLLVTDVDLPGLNGLELCSEVRKHSLIRHTPVVFLSAWDDFEERDRALRLKADDYIPKAASDRELLIRFQLVLNRYRDISHPLAAGGAIVGSVQVVGVSSILQMCHLNQLSGTCSVRSADGVARVEFRKGEIVGAQSPSARGSEAVYELLGWAEGQFEFVPGDPAPSPLLTHSFDFLLLEGCRRLDERRALAAEGVGGSSADASLRRSRARHVESPRGWM